MINVNEFLKKAGGIISKNSPIILTCTSVAGLISTTILAVDGTNKLRNDYYSLDDISFKAKLKISYKYYIPTVLMGGVTIACIIGAHSIHTRRNAALGSLYAISEAAIKEYQTKIVETIGKNKEQKIRDEISRDKIHNHPQGLAEVIITGKGEHLCFDPVSGRYFRSDIEKIRKCQNDMNEVLLREGFVSLNDLYYELGLPNIDYGYDMGWNLDTGQIDFSFSAQMSENDEPCIVLDYKVVPKYI